MQTDFSPSTTKSVGSSVTDSPASRPTKAPGRFRKPPPPTPESVYDARTGEWTGQFPAAELAVEPKHAPPKLDNTLKSLMLWVRDSVKLSADHKACLYAIVTHVNWTTGRGCTANVRTLAEQSGLALRATYTALADLKAEGVIGRRRGQAGKSAETWLIVDHIPKQKPLPIEGNEDIRTNVRPATGDTSRPATGDTSRPATGDRSVTSSSSTNPFNQSIPASPQTLAGSATPPDGGEFDVGRRTGTEQESARAAASPADVAEFMANIPPDPDYAVAHFMLKYYWPEWGAEHVKGGWQCTPERAAQEYCKNHQMWRKFQVDLKSKAMKMGVPPKAKAIPCDGCGGAEATPPFGAVFLRGGIGEEEYQVATECFKCIVVPPPRPRGRAALVRS